MSAGKKRAAEILAFPALQAIPAPSLPLQGKAYEKYLELTQSLLNSRKLNKFTQATCELIAIQHGAIAKRLEYNQVPSAKSIEAIGKLMKELQLVDESESTAPTPRGTENRFAKIGIIVRPGAKKAELRPS
jgi:hypothetical protein